MGTLLAAFAIAITLYCPFSVTIALKHGHPYLKFKADHILESFFFPHYLSKHCSANQC